ncbi:MAG: hypothetical protein J5700_00485, partial [Treponema sp.]|nr:hypothetical protein [Treponema sp.]
VDANHRRIVNFANMDVLDYELYNLFIWTGLRADFIPASWAKISLASEVALFWTAIDFDHHITNNRYFIDISYSAFYAFRQTIKAEFKIKEFFSLCPKATFLLTAESAGPPYIKENNSTKYKKQSGGSGAQIICVDLELSAKFTW